MHQLFVTAHETGKKFEKKRKPHYDSKKEREKEGENKLYLNDWSVQGKTKTKIVFSPTGYRGVGCSTSRVLFEGFALVWLCWPLLKLVAASTHT